MTQYSKGQRGKDFPPPVAKVTSDSPLWDWAAVARWLYRNRKLTRDRAIEAEIVKRANEALGAGDEHIGPRLKQQARECEASL